MNPFLSFKTRVFFSGEKLESCSYVLISLIFVYYVMNHSAYIFLYFFLDSFLGKDWWYTSSVTRTRMAIAKLFALHINSTRIVTITFLKFLKLTGNLLLKFLIKRENMPKNSAVEPDFNCWIKIFIKSYLLQELETISIIMPDISQNEADSVTFVYTRNW